MRCEIAPSVLSFDLPNLRGSVVELASLGAGWLHFDVMDGQFVPPITFGSAFIAALRPHVDLRFEAHLMSLTPERHFEAFAQAGCTRILFHVEATHHAHRLVQELRKIGVSPGIVLNPGTPVEAGLALVEDVDAVLVMTVDPGWGGQPFLPRTLDKVRAIRAARADVEIEVDGGIQPGTLRSAREAGANLFVVGNHLASAPSMAEAMQELLALCA